MRTRKGGQLLTLQLHSRPPRDGGRTIPACLLREPPLNWSALPVPGLSLRKVTGRRNPRAEKPCVPHTNIGPRAARLFSKGPFSSSRVFQLPQGWAWPHGAQLPGSATLGQRCCLSLLTLTEGVRAP